MEALITVGFQGKSYKVEVGYNPGKTVVGVKELIAAKLRDAVAGPRELSKMDVRVEDLTLKTLDGSAIEETKMPKGDEFLAELKIPESILVSELAPGVSGDSRFHRVSFFL